MQKYNVTLYYHANATVTVFADSEEEAAGKARGLVTAEDLEDSLVEDGGPDIIAAN